MDEPFAFLQAEEFKAIETRGHYDPDRQMWVGDHLSVASGSGSAEFTGSLYVSTGSFDLYVDIDTDSK
jgi:hypothetical protein